MVVHVADQTAEECVLSSNTKRYAKTHRKEWNVHCIVYFTVQLAREPGNSSTFRGFFVQSRTVADDSTRVGTFGVVNSSLAKLGPCTPMDVSIGPFDLCCIFEPLPAEVPW